MATSISRRALWGISLVLVFAGGTAVSATIRYDLDSSSTPASEQTFEIEAQAGGTCPPPDPEGPNLPFCPYANSKRDQRVYTIAADGDKDPIELCITWSGQVQVRVDGEFMAQAASGGGTAGADGITGEATTESSFVKLSSDPTTQIFGSVTSASTDEPSERLKADSIEKLFLVQDGDTVTVDAAAAAAARVPPGRTGVASASSTFTLRIGPCSGPPDPTPIPTLSEWAVIATTLLLATLGGFGLRRQRHQKPTE